MERLVAGVTVGLVERVVVEEGLVEERLPLFLSVRVSAEGEKVRILLLASRKTTFFM